MSTNDESDKNKSVRQHPHFEWHRPLVKTLPSRNPVPEDKWTVDWAVSS